MTWWCAATREPWSWTPRAYPGVWLFIAAIAAAAVLVVRRTGIRPTPKQRTAGWVGLATLWLTSDWPLGTLGAGYLAAAHMLQYFLFTFVATPLLLLSVPEPLARRVLVRPWADGAYRVLSKPFVAAVVVNGILLATHAPVTVDALRVNQLGSFLLDLLWLAGGLVLWLPVCGPVQEFRPTYPVRCVYLFLAAGLVPMVPGGFLTFADFPLYELYELAPRVWGIDPIQDQQAAGALMKIGSLPIVWPVIAAMFWRWARLEGATRRVRRPAAVAATVARHER